MSLNGKLQSFCNPICFFCFKKNLCSLDANHRNVKTQNTDTPVYSNVSRSQMPGCVHFFFFICIVRSWENSRRPCKISKQKISPSSYLTADCGQEKCRDCARAGQAHQLVLFLSRFPFPEDAIQRGMF